MSASKRLQKPDGGIIEISRLITVDIQYILVDL